ncbi:hypothetical protein GCM10009548_01920 [Streptomyces malaysiensis subsp. malaysiensis]|uniref:Uncharacterized protein n=1 Tax=Streptomyces malaysiensis TaxID=92644 RepID=A0ABX6W4C2_STRMQ|nr:MULTISPECIES: hypothetical protein [Streptomyces]QPI56343.1 hypothetical protein I1A49_16590 [Streptomyces solisilvae]UHH17830.1 hypothetical protein LUV23_16705 [Streptomyces sp. HNM0561]
MPAREVARLAKVDVDTPTALEVDDLVHEQEPALIARGAAYATEYARIRENAGILAKNLATVVVALRVRHDDMRGASGAYRKDVGEIYAGLGEGDREKLQTAVRWHVGNILRRYLTPRELEKLDLKPTSPLERQQDSRAANAAIVAAGRAELQAATSKKGRKPKDNELPAPTVRETADHLRMVHAATNIMNQLSPDVINHAMTDGQRAKLDEELETIQKAIAKLRRITRKARSEG